MLKIVFVVVTDELFQIINTVQPKCIHLFKQAQNTYGSE